MLNVTKQLIKILDVTIDYRQHRFNFVCNSIIKLVSDVTNTFDPLSCLLLQ